jgi:hypothetical protein
VELLISRSDGFQSREWNFFLEAWSRIWMANFRPPSSYIDQLGIHYPAVWAFSYRVKCVRCCRSRDKRERKKVLEQTTGISEAFFCPAIVPVPVKEERKTISALVSLTIFNAFSSKGFSFFYFLSHYFQSTTMISLLFLACFSSAHNDLSYQFLLFFLVFSSAHGSFAIKNEFIFVRLYVHRERRRKGKKRQKRKWEERKRAFHAWLISDLKKYLQRLSDRSGYVSTLRNYFGACTFSWPCEKFISHASPIRPIFTASLVLASKIPISAWNSFAPLALPPLSIVRA